MGLHSSQYHQLFSVHGFQNWVKVQKKNHKVLLNTREHLCIRKALSCKFVEDRKVGRRHICLHLSYSLL